MTRCLVCHRPLRDPVSLALGVGPVCRTHAPSAQLDLFEEVPSANKTRSIWIPELGDGLPLEAKGLAQCPRDELAGGPVVVVDFDAVRGLRAPWWLRAWRWVVRLARGL